MSELESGALQREWTTLQNNHEQYEKSALLIKLTGVVLCSIALVAALHPLLSGTILLILWVQEGIVRTGQARLGVRILRIESMLQQPASAAPACQLHTEWLASRPGVIGCLREYALNMCKPTVAFPYVVLLLMAARLGWQ